MSALHKSILTFTLVLVFAGVMAIVVIANMPYNAISSAIPQQTVFVKTLLPQGWAFFTKDPKSKFVKAYVWDENELKSVLTKNAELKNLFGLKRVSRAEFIALGQVVTRAVDLDWRHLESTMVDSIYDSIDLNYLYVNAARDYAFCNKEVLLIKEEIIPWAWRNNEFAISPYEVIKVYVYCD